MGQFEDLTLEEKSYIYGLLVTDGTLLITNSHQYTGSVVLEICKRDEDIVDKLCSLILHSSKTERCRSTNFKQEYHSVKFSIYRNSFIKSLVDFGFPTEQKTLNACPPAAEYDQNAFWRGVIDGDGSLGLRKSGQYTKPFLSLTTKSEKLKNAFCEYLFLITGKTYNPTRNKRDDIYNIGCGGITCCQVLREIYKDSTLYLNRKYEKYLECLGWEKNHIQ